MANSNAPAGLQWIGDIGAAPLSGSLREYVIPSSDSNDYFIGDPVKSTGTSTTDGVPTITIASAGDTLRGAIVGFKFAPTDLNKIYGPASTTRTVYVADSPFALFVVQSNGTLAATDIGANMDLVSGSGSTSTGLSGWQLDESSVTASSAQMRLYRLDPVTDNALGANGKVICLINEHEIKGTAGV